MTEKFHEAAFDGHLANLKQLIMQFEQLMNEKNIIAEERKKALQDLIDCRDAHNTSALSEAACGNGFFQL